MRGETQIINSGQDAQQAGVTREQAVAAATITTRYDDANYPEGYDTKLKSGDDGYIEPVYRYEEEIIQAVLDRFGFEI